MKLLYFLLTVPYIIIGKIFYFFNFFAIKNKLDKSIEVVNINSNSQEISNDYIEYLILAEDHRSRYHFGIDHIGMLRAIYIYLKYDKIQGASTIEQQFIRVVTNDYENSLFRKFKEQILAVLLVTKRDKYSIAKAYLSIAYYGYNFKGLKGIKNYLHNESKHTIENKIISIVARLKYPEPFNSSEKWEKKIYNRMNYIKYRYKKYNIKR